MSSAYQIQNEFATYFITPTIVEWVDIFTRKAYRDIVIDSINFAINNRELKVYGYVIMSNHMHLIVRSQNGKLSETLANMKKFTGKKIIDTIGSIPESRREWLLHRFQWNAVVNLRNSAHQLWRQENRAEEVFSYNFFMSKLNYLHSNPVRAGLVEQPEHYVYSSAKSLATGEKGLIEVTPWSF